jgi:riboflavin kinase / FMN adenylyltransferase
MQPQPVEHFDSFAQAGAALAAERPHQPPAPVWAAIGMFDGVHLGHQAILRGLAQEAQAAGATPLVITFHPHPVTVLREVTDPLYLTAPDERAQYMGELGIGHILTLPFTRELAGHTAEEFMAQVTGSLNLAQLWVGHDFALGRARKGDVPTLRQIGQALGYSVRVIDPVAESPQAGQRVSSSRIRELVRAGQVAEAARLLGRPYRLEGPVIHGDGRGRGLGIPTANVGYWVEKITPALGVYATWVRVNGERLPAVTSVGKNPTFVDNLTAPRVEAHLLDFDRDLYGQQARVDFLEFLRPERRYSSVEALLEQIAVDIQDAREVFAHAA